MSDLPKLIRACVVMFDAFPTLNKAYCIVLYCIVLYCKKLPTKTLFTWMEKIREIKTLKGTTTHQQVTHNKNNTKTRTDICINKSNKLYFLVTRITD